MLRIVESCRPLLLAAMVPATPELSTCVVLTGKPKLSPAKIIRLLVKNHQGAFSSEEVAALDNYKKHIDKATKFIHSWIKVAAALALGLGTMMSWKRIVVTVGERIGKGHLTYAQGACAELVAMATNETRSQTRMPAQSAVRRTEVDLPRAAQLCADQRRRQCGIPRN